MAFECLERFKVVFATLSTELLSKEIEVFRRSRRIMVNKVTLNALYKVNILWPKNVFPET